MNRYVEPRPKTEATRDVTLALVYAVRDQLYRDDQRHLFHGQLKDLKRAVTWPAKWMNEKALFVTAERYQEIILEQLQEIKRNGNTGSINYWPRYLLTCLQKHFIHQGERYYEEGKAARNLVSRLTSKLPTAPAAAPADEFTRTMAAAHALLKSPGRRPAKKEKDGNAPTQQSLF